MKMDRCKSIAAILVAITFVGCCLVIIVLFFISLVDMDAAQEIRPQEYKQVSEWTKEFPELHSMVRDATWEDSAINRSEFGKIKKESEYLRKAKLINDADASEVETFDPMYQPLKEI